MAPTNGWSDGTKWFMGIVSGVLVALIVAFFRGKAPDPKPDTPRIHTEQNAAPPPAPSPVAPPPTAADIAGVWNFEYQTAIGVFKWPAEFNEMGDFAIGPRGNDDFASTAALIREKSKWHFDQQHNVVVSFRTTLWSDKGLAIGQQREYLITNCRLQLVNRDLLQGNCVDGRGVAQLRLWR